MPKQLTNYEKFQWHFGVVENRMDPLQLGRVQVRFYGVHTEEKDKVETKQLPWATPIHPISGIATSGLGGPLTGIVEGAWVVGFFADEGSYQKPFILGAIAAIPTELPITEKGFNDPNGIYPKNIDDQHNINEPDLSRLSRGKSAEKHVIMLKKRASKIEGVVTAKAPEITLQDNKGGVDYENVKWNEPEPRGHKSDADPYPSKFPFNKVYESEGGSLLELDDTVDAQRIHTYHKSGTFEEIQPDGSKITKVVGSDYEVVIKDKNVLISGNLNITVNGNAKFFVKGDKYEEIDGNYFLTVRKDKIEKIAGNHLTEILTDRSTQINGNNAIRISGNDITTIDGNEDITVGGYHNETVTGDIDLTTLGTRTTTIFGTDNTTSVDSMNLGTANNLNMASGSLMKLKSISDMTIETEANQLINVVATQTITAATQDIDATTGTIDYNTGSIDVVSGNITDTTVTLNSHLHKVDDDDTGGTKVDSDPPTGGT